MMKLLDYLNQLTNPTLHRDIPHIPTIKVKETGKILQEQTIINIQHNSVKKPEKPT